MEVFQPSPPPKVTLVGCTKSMIPFNAFAGIEYGPLQLIAIIWKQSKEQKPLEQIVDEVRAMHANELAVLLLAVLEGVPVVEAVSFTFILENVSISWREQAVRHRVGTHHDPRVGVDWTFGIQEIPEQADLSMWSQSMRLLDLTDFAERRAYRTPDAVIAMDHATQLPDARCVTSADGGCEGIGCMHDILHVDGESFVEEWHRDMVAVQNVYKKWAQRGLALEDAREFIPLGATSRLSWTLNLRTLQHIVGKRGCTILQLGVWGPVILGMVQELVAKLHPVFGRLVTPPCMKGNKYCGCIFPEDIRRRAEGMDGYLPVCPLYIGKETGAQADGIRQKWDDGTLPNMEAITAEAQKREVFWGRDPFTGEHK